MAGTRSASSSNATGSSRIASLQASSARSTSPRASQALPRFLWNTASCGFSWIAFE